MKDPGIHVSTKAIDAISMAHSGPGVLVKCGRIWGKVFPHIEVSGWWGVDVPWSQITTICLN